MLNILEPPEKVAHHLLYHSSELDFGVIEVENKEDAPYIISGVEYIL